MDFKWQNWIPVNVPVSRSVSLVSISCKGCTDTEVSRIVILYILDLVLDRALLLSL